MSEQNPAPGGPLAGVRVVEVAGDVSIQFAGRILRGLGADVLMIEPVGGATTRHRTPLVRDSEGHERSVPFEHLNAGKSSQVLAGDDQDRARIAGWCAGADIVLVDASWWPTQHESLGAGVVVVNSLFGLTSPRTRDQHVSTDFTRYHAGGDGYFLPTSWDPDLRPTVPGRLIGESFAGVGIASAAMHGLNRVGAHGEAQVIDFSQQAYFVTLNKMFVSQSSYYRTPLDRFTHTYPFGGNLPCQDGYIAMLVLEESQWRGLARMVGREEWIGDPRYADGVLRRKNRQDLGPVVSAWCAARTTSAVIAAGREHDVPIGLVATPADVLAADPLRRRGFISEADTAFGRLPLTHLPFGKAFVPAPATAIAPLPGEAVPPRPDDDGSDVATRWLRDQPGAAADGRRLRVLDLTWAGAGPIITWTLATIGAEVAKIESPDRPDLLRRANRTYGWSDDDDLDASPAFNEMNANKMSVVIDLQTPEGQALALELAAAADVVCESMRPGRVEKLGLGYDKVRALNPAVVYCSLSATGRGTGRPTDIPGYAPVFWAEGGGAWLSGWPQASPDYVRSPVDMHAGIFASVGILAALHRRRQTGEGAHIDLSAIEAVSVTAGDAVLATALGQQDLHRVGNTSPQRMVNDVFPCVGQEQWVAISAADQRDLTLVATVLELNPAAVTALSGTPDLYATLAGSTRDWKADDLEKALQAAGIAASRVNSLLQLIDDEDLVRRGYWKDVPHPKLGVQRLSGLPWTVRGATPRRYDCSPLLDADTDDVLTRWADVEPERLAEARLTAAVGGTVPAHKRVSQDGLSGGAI